MPSFESSIAYLQRLIEFPSVSSTSNREISDWVSNQLEDLGFTIEQTDYRDRQGVEKVNIVAKRDPVTASPPTSGNAERSSSPTNGLAYFCHTDVVPTRGWNGPDGDPFSPKILNNRLYGRGSCDMKGSLATMMACAETLDRSHQKRPLWIVCTADEEVGFLGAKHLVQHSNTYRELISHQPLGLIGEPTRLSVVHAHKGIVGYRITSIGKAAHSSSRDGINANRKMVPFLQRLLEIGERTEADPRYHDPRYDPPTLSWNFGVSDECTAINITPDRSTAWVSYRPMPEIDGTDLREEIHRLAEELDLKIEPCGEGPPMWIDSDDPTIQKLSDLANSEPRTVCYGTDGGEFHELNHRVVFGPGDIAQAHTTDEWIALDQLADGTKTYSKVIRHWCC